MSSPNFSGSEFDLDLDAIESENPPPTEESIQEPPTQTVQHSDPDCPSPEKFQRKVNWKRGKNHQQVYAAKKSTTTDRADSVERYKNAVKYLRPREELTTKLNLPDRTVLREMLKSSSNQQFVYLRLWTLLQSFVNDLGGPEEMHKPGVLLGRWNWPTWHYNIIRRVVRSIVNAHPITDDDCWFSDLAYDPKGRPKLSVLPGVYEIRVGRSLSTNDKEAFFLIEDDSDFPRHDTSAARVMTTLIRGLPSDTKLEASHLCWNNPQFCINPHHTVWETKLQNAARKTCVGGTWEFCLHDPKCLWTDAEGRYLPCRNKNLLNGVCSCEDKKCLGPTQKPCEEFEAVKRKRKQQNQDYLTRKQLRLDV